MAAVRKKRGRPVAVKAASTTEPDAEGMLRGSDTGVKLAIDRGVVEVVRDVHVPDDPQDKRSLTRLAPRGQRVWAPDRLFKAGSIDADQWEAALRFYNDYSVGELGARTGPMSGGVRLDPWARLPFSERQAMARQSFRSAVKAAGPRFSSILVFCVLQETGGPSVPPTCEAYAKEQNARAEGAADEQRAPQLHWTTDKAAMWLSAALELLSVAYGFSRITHLPVGAGRP